jgi:hexokinase
MMQQCTSNTAEAPAKLSPPPTATTKQQFIDDVVSSFTAALDAKTLYEQSCELTRSLRSKLDIPDSLAMLPSFVDQLPTGKEQGDVLAIDIGGSTMRAAIVSLEPSAFNLMDRLRVRKLQSWPITLTVKSLAGSDFFSWIASNIQNFLCDLTRDGLDVEPSALPAGLVWSFPLE